MDGKTILEHIISTKILDEYRLKDASLDSLVIKLKKSFDEWQSMKRIYVSNQTIRASKIEPTFRRRLETIPEESKIPSSDEKVQASELRIAAAHFVEYLKSNPLAEIASVTLNCDLYHYDVKCGFYGQKLDVICVFKGNHIPDELLSR